MEISTISCDSVLLGPVKEIIEVLCYIQKCVGQIVS